MSQTRKVLQKMLTENTGVHFLDSGGQPQFDKEGKYIDSSDGYGRNWERNQAVNFEKTPESCLRITKWGIEATLDIYHWLANRLEYNEDLDKRFHEYADLPENEREPWLCLMEEFVYDVISDAKGIYGEGDPITINTYNHNSLLNQTIQFVYWNDNKGSHVLLQIHGGCDVRGGYTIPRAFDIQWSLDDLVMFDDQYAEITCQTCETYWYTNDGYHWHSGCSNYRNLEDYITDSEEEDNFCPCCETGVLKLSS